MDYDNAYLMHHGVKGMKWGVRRYRNYDGTLTNAGKAQRRKQGSGDGGRSGMSAKTKKRLATAAKVAGAAAAVGGAAYLANRASGGKLATTASNGIRNAKNTIGYNARLKGAQAKQRIQGSVESARNSKLGGKASELAGQASNGIRNAKNTIGYNARLKGAQAKQRIQGSVESARNSKLGGKASELAGQAKNAVSGSKEKARNAGERISNAASNARTNAKNKFNQYADKGQSIMEKRAAARSKPEARLKRSGNLVSSTSKIRDAASNVRNRISNSDAVFSMRTDAKATAGIAKNLGKQAAKKARNAGERISNAASNARTNAKNKFNQYADKGQSIMEKRAAARSKPEARLKRSGNLVSSTSKIRDAASNVRNRISNSDAVFSMRTDAKATAGIAKNLGKQAAKKARNAGERISNAASNARTNAKNKFNQYADKGQSIMEKRAAARSKPEARLKRSGNLVSSTSKIRDAASNVRNRISGAASKVASGARNAATGAKALYSTAKKYGDKSTRNKALAKASISEMNRQNKKKKRS